jgi:RecA-family ATPase
LGLATGSKVLGQIDVEQCGVLFLALEDSKWRIKDRLSAMLDDSPFPPELHFATECPIMGDGGLKEMDRCLKEHPSVRLVVVDVLGRFRKPTSSQNLFQADYSVIAKIKAVADRHSIAVILICHTNKLRDTPDVFDKISGTLGLPAASDTVMVLERYNRAEANANLHVAGRDVEARELALEFNSYDGSWKLLGDAEKYRTTAQRRAIIDYLAEAGEPKRTSEIAKALGKNHSTTRGLCSKMLKDRQLVQPERGLYTTYKHHKQKQQGQHCKQDEQT